ncbi:hypothetical protein ACF0H5_007618 [Mactra antiquata]
MSSAEKALIEDADNEQGVDSKPKENILFRKDTKYSWFVCACAFFTQIFVLGVLHAFGVFFVEFVKEFKASKGATAWIGSLAYGLSMTFSPVTSQLLTRFSYSKVMMIGGLFCVISLVASSFTESVPLLYFTFSVLYGIGTCMCTAPTMTITPEYFDKYMSVATGITVSGSSFGTLLMGPLSQFIIDTSGWRTAFRIYAGLIVITIFLNSKIRAPPSVKQRRLENRSFIKDMQIWKNRVFVIWTLAITLVMFGFYIPYVHLVSYAIDQGVSADLASLLMMILGGTTAVGRIMFGKIVQLGILNRLHMHQLSMIVTGAGVMLLPLIKSYIGIVMYVVTVGLVDGCFVVLLPIMTTALMGIEKTVIAWGFLIGACSVTFTLGPPVAGALYDATGNYDVAFHCAGVPIVAGAVILFLIPWAQRTARSTNILSTEITSTLQGSSQDSSPYRTDSSDTVCEGIINNIQLGSYRHVAVQTDITSLHMSEHSDKSTLTDDVSLHQVSLDLSETLSQLSHNSRVFDDIIQRSLSSSRSQCASSGTSYEIPRIPPPVSSRSTTDEKSQTKSLPMKINYSTEARQSPRSRHAAGKSSAATSCSQADGSHDNLGFVPRPDSIDTHEEISVSSALINPSVTSDFSYQEQSASCPDISSANVINTDYPSPVSHLFGYTGSPLQPQPSDMSDNRQNFQSLKAESNISQTVDNELVKQESNFDQTISDQVNMLRETLKSPTPCSSAMEERVTSQPVSVKSSKQTSPCGSLADPYSNTDCRPFSRQSSLASETSNPFLQQEPGPSRSEAIKLIQDAIEADDSFQQAFINQPQTSSTQSECSKDDHDNQATITPGNNPFVFKPSSQTTTKLEDLFKPIAEESNLQGKTSHELLTTDSSNILQQTVSQTGELDVFRHLFEDEETNN